MSEINFNDLDQVVGGAEDTKGNWECWVKPHEHGTCGKSDLDATFDREYNQGGLEVKEWDSQSVYHV